MEIAQTRFERVDLRSGPSGPVNAAGSLGADILVGAAAISTFIFGSPRERRKVYHQAESGHLPVFRIGSTICARRSTLKQWISDQEQSSWSHQATPSIASEEEEAA